MMALAVIVGLVLLYQSHILENWVNRYLADKLADEYGLEVIISEIDGSFVNGFSLKDVMVKYNRPDTSYTLAYLPRISMKYNMSDIWNLQWIVDTLKLENPQVYLIQDDSGKIILPQIAAKGSSGNIMPSWQVGNIQITGGEFVFNVGDTVYKWYDVQLNSTARSEEGTLTVGIQSMRFNSDDGRLRVNHASGLATIFHKKIALQNVNIQTDSSHINFSLVLDQTKELWTEVTIEQSRIHLQDFISFVGSRLSGNLNVRGSLYSQFGRFGGDLLISGDFVKRQFDSLNARFHISDKNVYFDSLHGTVLNGCEINGFGSMSFGSAPSGYNLSADIKNFNLSDLISNSFSSDLSGHLELNGRGLQSETMAIDIDTKLDESYFDRYHFHQSSGQMTITRNGLYLFPGYRFDYYENQFLCEGDVNYRGNLDLTCRANFENLSRFTHQTFIDLPAGVGKASFNFTGPTKDPALSGTFQSDSVFFYDFYSTDFYTEFNIESFVKRKKGPVKVWSRSGDAWSFPYDSIFAEMTLDSNLLILDTVVVSNQFSQISSIGVLDYEKYPRELRLDTLEIELSDRFFYSDGSQVILIDSTGFILSNINIKGSNGFIDVDGRANYDESLNLNWNIKSISAGPWVDLLNDSLEIDGILSSNGNIQGHFSNPYFELEATLDSLTYQELVLGDLRTFLTYNDTLLHIDSCFLKSEEGIYTAQGEFPINLALSMDHELFDEREQSITIHAEDKRLDLAAFVLESVEYMIGDFWADIKLSGQPLKPHLNGNFQLNNGEIKLIDLKDKLEQVEVALTLQDNRVQIDKAQALMPHKDSKIPGKIFAEGDIIINDISIFTFNINATCEQMPLNYELGDFTGLADADIIITGQTPPTVVGTIKVHNAYYRESFEEESGFSILTALEADKSWNLNLMVDCPSNFWTKNDDIDAEYGGSLNIRRVAGVYNFLGTLEVIRGKYYLFDKKFRIIPGGQIIYDNIEELDPRLNLEITTRIRTQSRFTGYETEDSYSYELPLLVSGTLNKPIITVTGDAPISNENILLTILTNSNVESSGSSSSFSNRIEVGGANLLANQASRIGTRTLGVETFEINPDAAGGFNPSGTRVTIGTYTLPNLYIFGSSYFDVNKGQEVGLEYRLSKHYLFEGRRDEFNLYHFSFKFQWEY